MNTFNDFIRGNGVGQYVHEEDHFYRIDLGDMFLIMCEFLNDYRTKSVIHTRIDPHIVGFYIKELDTFVSDASYYFSDLGESAINCVEPSEIIEQYFSELEARCLKVSCAEEPLSNQIIDKLIPEFDMSEFYEPFLLDKERLCPNILTYYIEKAEINVLDIIDYLKQPQAHIATLAEKLMASECGPEIIQDWQKELMYQRYKQFHNERQTYKKEQALMKVLREDFRYAKKFWLILNDGTEKRVCNMWKIESTHILIGAWFEQVSSNDFQAIRFRKGIINLPKKGREKGGYCMKTYNDFIRENTEQGALYYSLHKKIYENHHKDFEDFTPIKFNDEEQTNPYVLSVDVINCLVNGYLEYEDAKALLITPQQLGELLIKENVIYANSASDEIIKEINYTFEKKSYSKLSVLSCHTKWTTQTLRGKRIFLTDAYKYIDKLGMALFFLSVQRELHENYHLNPNQHTRNI